jgi:hypothetical protein
MEHYEVESSMIDRMGYDAETRVLEVLGSSKAHSKICESISIFILQETLLRSSPNRQRKQHFPFLLIRPV